MDETPGRFAYRCLPMLIANQAGWFILNRHKVRATWSGEAEAGSLTVEYIGSIPATPPAVSHFGSGIRIAGERKETEWQKEYFRGGAGVNASAHQTRLALRPFRRE